MKSFFQKKYTINGKQYDSLDGVPEKLRTFFEDKDGDGCPDWIQNQMEHIESQTSSSSIKTTTINGATTYEVNGQQYGSLEEMPEQHRRLFEDRSGDGYPDIFPGVPRLRHAGVQRTSLLAEPIPATVLPDEDAEEEQPQPRNRRPQVERPQQEEEVEELPRRRFSSGRDLEFEGESKGGAVFLLLLLAPIAVLVAILVGLVLYFSGLL